jgi:hypothetical protein
VLSEIMYHPTSGRDEYVEIRNTTSEAVPLFDPAVPTNTWRVTGIGYDFPPSVTLGPGQIVILSSIDPATFRTKYGVAANIPIFGPFGGSLDNGGEAVAIQKPGTPFIDATSQTVVPRIDVDRVTYDDAGPWPTRPDGAGPALERINPLGFADDPANWRASVANGNPGWPAPLTFDQWRANFFTSSQLSNSLVSGPQADPDGDGVANAFEDAMGTSPLVRDNSVPTATTVADGGSNYLALTFPRNFAAQGVVVEALATGDLALWQAGTAVQVGGPIDNGNGTEMVTFRDTVPITPGATHRYMRLRATITP